MYNKKRTMRKRNKINQLSVFNQVKREIKQFSKAYSRGKALNELMIKLRSLDDTFRIRDMKKKFLYEISRLFHIEGIIFDLKNIKMKVEKSFTFQNSEKQDLLRIINSVILKFEIINNNFKTYHPTVKSRVEKKKVLTYYRKLFNKCDQALKNYNRGRITTKEVVDAIDVIAKIKLSTSDNIKLIIPLADKFKSRQIVQRFINLSQKLENNQTLKPEEKYNYIDRIRMNGFKCRTIIKIVEIER